MVPALSLSAAYPWARREAARRMADTQHARMHKAVRDALERVSAAADHADRAREHAHKLAQDAYLADLRAAS